MTFAQLRADAERLCSLEGWADSSVHPDWHSLVLRALTEFSWTGEYYSDVATVVSVSGQQEYNPDATGSQPWRRIMSVLYGGVLIPQVTLMQLSRISPTWMVDAAGSPSYWFASRPGVFKLYPKPDASSTDIVVTGWRCEPALSEDSDTPMCPEPYHPHIARLAAALHGELYATSQSQQEKIALWKADAQDAAISCRGVDSEQMVPELSSRARPMASPRMRL